MITFIYYDVKSYIVCRGARAAKGGGLKILWCRPSRVRIPSPALNTFLNDFYRPIRLSGSAGRALPW